MTSVNESEVNPMREIQIEKVMINMSVGQSGEPLERAKKVLAQISNQKVCTRQAKQTVKDFGIRKGEPIACLVTLRKDNAIDFLKKALEALENKLKISKFDEFGNFSFGINEHIDIPGTKYVPELGIIGMDVIVNLKRRGYRVKRKKIRKSNVGSNHLISKTEAIDFIKKNFGTVIT
jgi:large subunit ribosomal protein L5